MKINDFSIITPDILNTIWWNKASVNNKLSRYQKEGKLIRLKRGYYVNPNKEINIFELSNMIFGESYISLDSILFENWIIKQYSKNVYSLSTKWKTENIKIGDKNLYKFIINIDTNSWIEIDNSWIRKASTERAILDNIYFKIFSKNYPWDNELNLLWIDKEAINKLLKFYPERVKKYYLKLINE